MLRLACLGRLITLLVLVVFLNLSRRGRARVSAGLASSLRSHPPFSRHRHGCLHCPFRRTLTRPRRKETCMQKGERRGLCNALW
ncbi:hypothetical protein B0H67DRAFT_561826 [Lasiosphaeris hirsuta]|uniref:Uncharacterized protein n=1 Tax=Lasiosphaeris hirsuta TaxID=260670 RepID=A0AA40BAL1_9PEZI|nr:hypothetical protein B0H67DRAFT_561826 [Lasiosphaeris hirsuta]